MSSSNGVGYSYWNKKKNYFTQTVLPTYAFIEIFFFFCKTILFHIGTHILIVQYVYILN